jgi:hypothetical protein
MAFTPDAQVEWDKVSADDQAALLQAGFCTRCLATRAFTLDMGEMRGHELALIGHCDTCGARVVRLIDTRS